MLHLLFTMCSTFYLFENYFNSSFFQHEILDSSVLVHPYHVVMHESYFRLHFNGLNISRAIMMTALQNIKHIFVRGTTSPDFTQVV